MVYLLKNAFKLLCGSCNFPGYARGRGTLGRDVKKRRYAIDIHCFLILTVSSDARGSSISYIASTEARGNPGACIHIYLIQTNIFSAFARGTGRERVSNIASADCAGCAALFLDSHRTKVWYCGWARGERGAGSGCFISHIFRFKYISLVLPRNDRERKISESM